MKETTGSEEQYNREVRDWIVQILEESDDYTLFKSLAHSRALGVMIAVDGRLAWLDETAAAMFNLDRAAVLETGLKGAASDQVLAGLVELVERFETKGKRQERFDLAGLGPEGRKMEVSATMSRTVLSGREAVLITLENRTGLERPEPANHESYGDLHRTLLENLGYVVFAMDREGRVTYISPIVEELYGVSPDEIIGYTFSEWFTPLNISNFQWCGFEFDYEGSATGLDNCYEFNIRLPNGDFRYARISSQVQRKDGRMEGLIGIITDVTDRRKTYEALAHTEAKYRELVENVSNIIFRFDTQGRTTFMNRYGLEFFGYSLEEVLGRHIIGLIIPEIDSEGRELGNLVEEIRRNPESYQFNVNENITKSGERVWISWTNAPVYDDQGQLVEIMCVGNDITERIQAEQALQEAKVAAETANRAKSEFLANMSHEIRTPLNGVIGMTALALETGLTEEQREYLNLVKLSADALYSLVNDVLDFSKIEAGKLVLEETGLRLRDSLSDTLKPIGPEAFRKGLELALQVDPDVPDELVGDPGRLRQIVLNLVGNAVKFTDRGEVVVKVELKSEDQEKADLHFLVQDTGQGIPGEKLGHIFLPFTQADGSITRRKGGTGLGLAISSQLVKAMGGRIWVESLPGQGSSFHFTINFKKWINPPSRKAFPDSGRFAKPPLVLIVVDNATQRDILEKRLKAWGLLPLAVENGWRAMEEVDKARQLGREISLMLIDVNMTGQDGFELAARLKENPGLAGARIIMVTASGQRGDATRCRELGLVGYLSKPIKESVLLEAVMKALEVPVAPAGDQSLITRHSLREGRRRLKILLAEDNEVNQKLAIRLLERRGHAVVLAANGLEAIQAYDREYFDLILMDLQMPEMDGLEAAEIIRAKEKATGRRIPIVALTAQAMTNDRNRSLAAGMDGYIAKPFQADQMLNLIENLVKDGPGFEAPEPVSTEKKLDSAQDIFDLNEVMVRVGDDPALLAELAGIFLDSVPDWLDRIKKALGCQDSEEVRIIAHSLKGAAGNLSACGVQKAALALEKVGRAGDLANAPPAVASLEKELARLEPILKSLIRDY